MYIYDTNNNDPYSKRAFTKHGNVNMPVKVSVDVFAVGCTDGETQSQCQFCAFD